MPVREDLAIKLLESIAAERLVLFLGAGLSMPAPSCVPGAARLAELCATKHATITNQEMTPLDETDPLGTLARTFNERNALENIFIDHLVDWQPFRGHPNRGHEAVADFVGANITDFAITTNLDTLVEIAAREIGEFDFRASIDSVEVNINRQHAPLVKLHGCCLIQRHRTLWCQEQLQDQYWIEILDGFRNWLEVRLAHRDIVFVGYWSDWGYLHHALTRCLRDITPRMTVLVDPGDAEILAQKAPDLWDWSHRDQIDFEHEPMSGDDFLDELRRRFSQVFVAQTLAIGQATLPRRGNDDPPQTPSYASLSSRELYDLRRDMTGVSRSDVVRSKTPGPSHEVLAHFILRLFESGATIDGSHYRLDEQTIRVVLANGHMLSSAVARLADDTPYVDDLIVVFVGARDDGDVPSDIVRSGETATVVRPQPAGRWVTDDRAQEVIRSL